MLATTLLTVGSCRHCERLARRGGRWRFVEFPALVALLRHPRLGPILYDTGYASHFAAATRPFPERLYRWTTPYQLPAEQTLATQLARVGLTPADIRWCVISHFHGDHVAGLRDLPNATFICLRADLEGASTGSRFSRVRKGVLSALLPGDFHARVRFADQCASRALPRALDALGPAVDLLGDGTLTGVRLPGHTAGQLGLVFRDAHERPVLLCGDAAWHRQAIRADEPPSRAAALIKHDWSTYLATLGRLQAVVSASPDLHVVPSHCAESIAAYRALPR